MPNFTIYITSTFYITQNPEYTKSLPTQLRNINFFVSSRIRQVYLYDNTRWHIQKTSHSSQLFLLISQDQSSSHASEPPSPPTHTTKNHSLAISPRGPQHSTIGGSPATRTRVCAHACVYIDLARTLGQFQKAARVAYILACARARPRHTIREATRVFREIIARSRAAAGH